MSDTETHLTDVGRRLTLAAGASQERDAPRSSCHLAPKQMHRGVSGADDPWPKRMLERVKFAIQRCQAKRDDPGVQAQRTRWGWSCWSCRCRTSGVGWSMSWCCAVATRTGCCWRPSRPIPPLRVQLGTHMRWASPGRTVRSCSQGVEAASTMDLLAGAAWRRQHLPPGRDRPAGGQDPARTGPGGFRRRWAAVPHRRRRVPENPYKSIARAWRPAHPEWRGSSAITPMAAGLASSLLTSSPLEGV